MIRRGKPREANDTDDEMHGNAAPRLTAHSGDPNGKNIFTTHFLRDPFSARDHFPVRAVHSRCGSG